MISKAQCGGLAQKWVARWQERGSILGPSCQSTGCVIDTTTTSEIVDQPTFLEQVLFGTETEVETTTHQSGGSTNFSYGLGAGVIIKNFLMIGVRYQHANPVDYINTSNVSVKNGEVQYEVNRIPLDMIQVTIGIGIWKMP